MINIYLKHIKNNIYFIYLIANIIIKTLKY